MAVSTEAQPETPSSFIEKQIHTILTPANIRKQFNITITSYKVLNNTRTTIDFLQNSLKSKIIPPTFKIRNTFYNNTDTNTTKVQNLLHQTSTTLIKITIDGLKAKEHTQFDKHLKELHTLLNLIPNEADKDRILDKMTHMESKFRHKTTEKSIQKLKWLKQKEHQSNTDKPPHQQTPNNTEDNQQKSKKHRRFVKRTKWRNLQKKKQSQQITAIYNYSTMTLTSAMSKVLNRGLNFCVTPETINVTELLVDYRKFERKMKWREFFHDKEEDTIEYIPPIFSNREI